jgi:hypothetical protein
MPWLGASSACPPTGGGVWELPCGSVVRGWRFPPARERLGVVVRRAGSGIRRARDVSGRRSSAAGVGAPRGGDRVGDGPLPWPSGIIAGMRRLCSGRPLHNVRTRFHPGRASRDPASVCRDRGNNTPQNRSGPSLGFARLRCITSC